MNVKEITGKQSGKYPIRVTAVSCVINAAIIPMNGTGTGPVSIRQTESVELYLPGKADLEKEHSATRQNRS